MNALDQAWGVLKSIYSDDSDEHLVALLVAIPVDDFRHPMIMEEIEQRLRFGTDRERSNLIALMEKAANKKMQEMGKEPVITNPPQEYADMGLDFPENFDREKLASADAFTSAWDVVKAEWKLFPKKNEKSPEIGGERPVGYSMVPLDNLEATTSYVNLPFIPQYGHEQDIADDVLAATSHEDTHRAMAQIGEFYDDPTKDEYAPHITEAIMRTRDKGQFTMPVTQLARLLMRLHPQVKRRSYE